VRARAGLRVLLPSLQSPAADTAFMFFLCRTDMGGEGADRSGAEGAASVLAPWLKWEPSLNGGFSRDGERMEW
jgi:hypothetical protein